MAQNEFVPPEMVAHISEVIKRLRSVSDKSAKTAKQWIKSHPKGVNRLGKTYTVYSRNGDPVAHGSYHQCCEQMGISQNTFSGALTKYHKGTYTKYIFSVIDREE